MGAKPGWQLALNSGGHPVNYLQHGKVVVSGILSVHGGPAPLGQYDGVPEADDQACVSPGIIPPAGSLTMTFSRGL